MKESYGWTNHNKWDESVNPKDPNKCIRCNVSNCKHHCKYDNFCALDSITIDSNKDAPKNCESVDCKSFVSKKPESSKNPLFGALDSVKDSFKDTFLS